MAKFVIVLLLLAAMVSGCGESERVDSSRKSESSPKDPVKKPGSTNSETRKFDSAAVVFFYPDSVQLEHFREANGDQIYESTNHDSYYQMRNAKNVLLTQWPGIRVSEVRDARYLAFVRKDSSIFKYDLDTLDLYGMIIFDGERDPTVVDMMNVDTELGFYFRKQ